MSALAERYAQVQGAIASKLTEVGRSASEVTLIVISKNYDSQLVRDLHDFGQRDFGENRDQEAAPKAAQTSDLAGVNWHFVGQLQTNKVKSVLGYARTIHSLDRDSLLSEVAKQALKLDFQPEVFIQLNLTDDPGRGGIATQDLAAFAERVLANESLRLRGVMGVAALERDPRFDFETIREASQALQQLEPLANSISAGMSHDFEAALEFGATHLRIGTAITGNRNL